MRVTALAGGVGGAKLLVGLDQTGAETTAIINTGDDAVIYGVHVSPDIDICTYWLAGIADTAKGWGIQNDTFDLVASWGKLGGDNWFSLGDRDLATCLFRTQRLSEGATLTGVTDEIRTALGVEMRLLPMSDDPVRTKIKTVDGDVLEFQEYFVRERQQPEVAEVRFAGLADAKPGPDVLSSIRSADVVVLCPSNPIVSIAPILALPEVRATLVAHPRVIAFSPIVGGAALKGPADKMLRSQGIDVSAAGVAGLYRDFVNAFVIDHADEREALDIEAMGIEVVVTDTIMTDHERSRMLAEAIL